MTNSLPRRETDIVETKTLAPVIPLRSAPKENSRPVRKVSKNGEELNTPMIYNKPIFKSRKYDLL